LSVGNGIFEGVSGVFIEPVRHARKDGFVGFAKGVGKGLTGVVLKPVAGVIDLASKTTQGVINTPISVYDAIKSHKEEHVQLQLQIANSKKGKMFGVPLEVSYAYAEQANITHVTSECIRYLVDYVQEEGLFRVPGNTNIVAELKDIFDKGEQVTLTNEGEPNYGPAEVAGLLKLYLRALPEPLLTFERYNSFLFLQQNSTEHKDKLLAIKALLDTLPAPNKILLYQLIKLLKIVADNADKNLMKASNLAMVFGPALLRKPENTDKDDKNSAEDTQQLFLEVSLSSGVVNEFITNFEQLFGDMVF